MFSGIATDGYLEDHDIYCDPANPTPDCDECKREQEEREAEDDDDDQ